MISTRGCVSDQFCLFDRVYRIADINIDSELLRDILLDERSDAIDEHVDRNAQGLRHCIRVLV